MDCTFTSESWMDCSFTCEVVPMRSDSGGEVRSTPKLKASTRTSGETSRLDGALYSVFGRVIAWEYSVQGRLFVCGRLVLEACVPGLPDAVPCDCCVHGLVPTRVPIGAISREQVEVSNEMCFRPRELSTCRPLLACAARFMLEAPLPILHLCF